MRLPKNYFANLSTERYREYLKLLPDLKDEKTQMYTMLAFTLGALSFFGIFAIQPTLNTITELKRQLADSKYVHEQLTAKINNLSQLQQRYGILQPDLPVVYNAIPNKAEVPTFLAQVRTLAQQANLHVTTLRSGEVLVSKPSQKTPNAYSFVFSLEAQGAYEDMLKFAVSLSHFNRLVTIELFSVSKDAKKEALVLNIRGREYFY